MGQCRTFDVDVTIVYYYGDQFRHITTPTSVLNLNNFFPHLSLYVLDYDVQITHDRLTY